MYFGVYTLFRHNIEIGVPGDMSVFMCKSVCGYTCVSLCVCVCTYRYTHIHNTYTYVLNIYRFLVFIL